MSISVEKTTRARRWAAGVVAFAVGALAAVAGLVSAPQASAATISQVQQAFASYMKSHNNTYGGLLLSRNGCVTLSAWYIGTQTNYKYGGGDGNQVVQNLVNANPGLKVSSTPVAPAIFSVGGGNLVWGASGDDGRKHGHVGIVLSVSGNKATVLHTGVSAAGRVDRSWINTYTFPQAGVTFVNLSSSPIAPLPPRTVGTPSYPNGSFILNQGTIYRMAGGAPIPVSNWANVGGSQPYTSVSDAQFNALPKVPADGTVIAGGGHVYVVAGGAPIYVSSFNNVPGSTSYVSVDGVAINNAGGDGVWSHLKKVPANGTYLNSSTSGTIYVVAGGAPIPVSNWNNVGGPKPYVTVDGVAIDNSGGSGVWAHLNKVPSNGTVIAGGGNVYVVAGGAPVYVSSFNNVPGSTSYVTVDGVAIDNAGGSGCWSHLNKVPVDDTYLNSSTSGTIYVVAGGAPIAVSNWDNVGGPKPYVTVDGVAIDNAGNSGVWAHLNKVPVNGTFLNSKSGTVYVVAGGAPIAVSNWDNVGGVHPYVTIDQVALDNAGGSGCWSHLNKVPADGTVIHGAGNIYVVAGGAPIYVSNFANVPGSTSYTTIDGVAIDNAGGPTCWSHLNKVPANGTFIKGYASGNVYQVNSGVPTLWTAAVPSGVTPVVVDQNAVDKAGQSGVWSHLLK